MAMSSPSASSSLPSTPGAATDFSTSATAPQASGRATGASLVTLMVTVAVFDSPEEAAVDAIPNVSASTYEALEVYEAAVAAETERQCRASTSFTSLGGETATELRIVRTGRPAPRRSEASVDGAVRVADRHRQEAGICRPRATAAAARSATARERTCIG